MLSQKIEQYFELCDSLNNAAEKDKKQVKPYTLSGLLFYLDIGEAELEKLCESRAHARVINAAKRRIEAYIEENALNGRLASTAAINSLKEHFGWSGGDKNGEQNLPIEIFLDKDCDSLGI